MRRLLLIINLFAFSFILNAQTTLHVYSKEIPWSEEPVVEDVTNIYSIGEALNAAQAGDEIIVHEGIYREKITVAKNNITIKNFENDYVLVSGAELITGWSDASGMASGVKVADVTGVSIETDYTQLFSNGHSQMMGRHPNNVTGDMMEPMNAQSGYALLSNVHKDAGANANGYATLEGTTLPNVNLTGAIFRGLTGKMRNYVYGKVSSSSGNSVTFKAINNGVWKNDAEIKNTQHKFSWGFVMHKNLIDYPGEWFLDGNQLYYKPHGYEDMNDSRVEIQVRERVLVINNISGVTIQGINFIAGNVDMQNTSNTTIESCSFRYLYPFWTPNGYGQGDSDPKGIYMNNSSDNLFKDVYVGHSWGNMFAVKNGANNTFDNCTIEDFGWVGIFTSGIHLTSSNNTNISKCTFGDAGRFQVRLDGGDAKVNITDCDFYGAMKMGEDAGPIEATSTGKIGALDLKGSVIAYNRVHDVQGVPISDGNYNKVKATAFYMEDTQNYTAHHNLIYNIKHTLYNGSQSIEKVGEFLYMGPRYNSMHKPVNYYNNTIWNVDDNISIWNIEIDNWAELGIAPPDTTGLMDDGHFVNNIFMNGPEYGISYVRQKLSPTGSNLGYVTLNPSPSLTTTNFNQYTTYCATLNYHFNPQTNVIFNASEASANFENYLDGNFALKSTSSAKGFGTEITGITSSSTPDCGAFEGGDRVLNSGSNITLPEFKEKAIFDTGISRQPAYDDISIYPNPVNEWLYIDVDKTIPASTKVQVFNVSGNVLLSQNVNGYENEIKLNVSELSKGIYFVSLSNFHHKRLVFTKY